MPVITLVLVLLITDVFVSGAIFIMSSTTKSQEVPELFSKVQLFLTEPLIKVQKLARLVIENDIPLFGICLGHQIIALANGIKTYKMFNGHRGINHPVINLITGKGEITSQNHGFAVDKASAESNPDFLISHLHLNDDTVAGLQMKNKNCFSVQYHPEAGPGPNDTLYLFDQFYENIKKFKS